MTDTPLPTKDRLILTAAQAPKGSLYHHFTNGKSDLALAAATWVLDGLLRVIAASFEPTDSFDQGARTLFHKLAKLFDLSGHWDGCPISAILFEGPDNAVFRAHAAHLFEGWISEVAHITANGSALPLTQPKRPPKRSTS